MRRNFSNYDAFIFDLDGTIYLDDEIIPAADETINHLSDKKKKIIFISNKTTGTIKNYHRFLSSKGLNIKVNQIINSTLVLSNYLKEKHSGETFYAVGEKSFVNEIEEAGLRFSNEPDKIKILIVTLDRTLNYKKLEIAAKALENGARFYAANIDDTCPVKSGEVLDAGSTISALEKRTHKKLELHFGKPSNFMIDEIKKHINFDLEKSLLIGDRLETDILMGNIIGIDTALVKSGVKNFYNGNSHIKPTYLLNSVFDLIK